MAASVPSKKSTGQVVKQGHTAGPYGNDGSRDAKGAAGQPARDLKA